MGNSKSKAGHGAPSKAVKRLLPRGSMPKCALLWVERRQSDDLSERGKASKQARAATEWVLDALCHAHEDSQLKKSARRLLAVRYFTSNLDAWPGDWLFRDVLKPGLKQRLVTLGHELLADYDRNRLAERLSDAAVTAAVGSPDDHPLARALRTAKPAGDTADGNHADRQHHHQQHRRPTQIDVLPCVAPIDFAKPEEFPEEAYAHAILMVAAVLDAVLQAIAAATVVKHNREYNGGEGGTAKHSAAPPKAVARVLGKMSSDYKYEENPRAQHNVDVVRCLVSADTPEELLALCKALSEAFGGVVRLKNLFSAPLAEREERFHLLPLMLTVEVGARGATYGELMLRPDVREAMDVYVCARDPTVPPHRWAETTTCARAMLASDTLSSLPVRLLGEVQMVLESHGKVRHMMHEVYKAFRAESPQLLWEDFARTAMVEEGVESGGGGDDDDGGGGGGLDDLAEVPDTLWWAAAWGNRPAVEAFLREEEVDVNEVVDDSAGPLTALYVACERGFTDVVKVLVGAGADVNRGDASTGASPLCIAAENGYVDVVAMLVNVDANVNQAKTDDGTTPMYMAAQQGNVDVVRVLADAGANVDQARIDDGATPLFMAVHNGLVDVVKALVDAGANVNQATTDAGATPLHKAAHKGDVRVIKLLIDASANIHALDLDGESPLVWAQNYGTPDAVAALRAAGATH